MKLYKKTLLTILLLIFSVNLKTAVVYIDGWAAGKIISIKNNDAYLLTEASGKKKNQNILIAFNFSDNIIKWETPVIGNLNTFVQTTNDRLVTIESDTVIARNPQDGNIIWKIDLRAISTGPQDATPNEYKPHISYVWKKVYNRCVQEPSKAKWFDYTTFMPDGNNFFLFRIARYHYDGPLPYEKDWVQIDLRSGKVMGKGCYALIGFSKDMAFITEYRDVFKEISINSPLDYFNKIVAAGDYLVQIATGQKSRSKKKQEVSWIEVYNLEGKIIQKKTDDVGESFKADYLGQTQNGDILIKKGKVIERYSVPGLKLVSKFNLEKNDDFVYLYGEFLFSEGENGLVLSYSTVPIPSVSSVTSVAKSNLIDGLKLLLNKQNAIILELESALQISQTISQSNYLFYTKGW
jgi:hypothetical protein